MAILIQQPEDPYMASFWACFSKEKANTISDRAKLMPSSKTRASYHTRHEQKYLKLGDISPPSGGNLALAGAVVIIENIDLLWIAALGNTWDIAPSFFADHASNPSGSSPWKTIFGMSSTDRKMPLRKEVTSTLPRDRQPWDKASSWYVDGIFECGQPTPGTSFNANDQDFIQRIRYNNDLGLNISTRISCWTCSNKHQSLCLILVDTPISTGPDGVLVTSDPRAQLFLPISNNRGGLLMPQLFDRPKHSLCECLQRFLTHPWHFNVLFLNTENAITPENFLYLLVSSTWETNLRYLDQDIKRIGFKEIRKPTTNINNQLHDRRQDLVYLYEQVAIARKWMPQSVKDQLHAINVAAQREGKYMGFPDEMLKDILKRSEVLEKFLMDSFNILASSTSVLVAEQSVEQGIRGQRFATLAFLYIPLSFVTGIFGMNVREINGSPLSVWVFAVVLGITIVLTAVIFIIYAGWEKHRVRRTTGF